MKQLKKAGKITTFTGISIVVANMIGTGVFTSLGFQLEGLSNTAVILTLWILGGVLALSGAFSYAEVAGKIQKSGGEYSFLSEIYHPVVGYLSGWVSLTVGFAAPVALSVIAFTEYFPVPLKYPKIAGIALLTLITWMHSQNLNISSVFQNIATLFKVISIVLLIVLGFVFPSGTETAINFDQPFFSQISSAAFAVSLIYVSYSYSGWNAAAYITEEFRNPRKSLPLSLILGTLAVCILYTLLQFIFLKHAPMQALTGKLNVGTIAVQYMLGDGFGVIFSAVISLLLISGISSMVWVGPRVTVCMGKDYRLWRFFSENKKGIPVKALWFQYALSTLLLITGTFEQIMIYCGILLTLSAMFVVFGVFILRFKNKNSDTNSYKSPFFPLFQVLFLILSSWMIVFAFINNTLETIIGMSNLAVGLGIYFLSGRSKT